jgi:hypothetical protein
VVVGVSAVVVVVSSVVVPGSVVVVVDPVSEVLPPSSPHAAPARIKEKSKEECRRERILTSYHKPMAREILHAHKARGRVRVGGRPGP